MLKVVGSMMMQPTRKEENWKEKNIFWPDPTVLIVHHIQLYVCVSADEAWARGGGCKCKGALVSLTGCRLRHPSSTRREGR
jgi:hypothetical protein